MRGLSGLKERSGGTEGILAAYVIRQVRKHGRAILLATVGLVITIAIRVQLFDFHSSDLDRFGLVWFKNLQKLGLGEALKSGNVDYNPTYIYLLWLLTKLPFSHLVLIKLSSVVCDYACAASLAFIVYHVHRSKLRASIAGFALLCTPTVVFNSSLWGQCDMVFALPLMLALAAALRKNYYLTSALFGVALAVKLQAIFLFPLLGIWVLRKEFPWRPLLLIPMIFFASLVPAWIAGCSLADLLMIYPNQTVNYTSLNMNAPSIFNLLPDNGTWFGPFGLWFASAVTFMAAIACLYAQKSTTAILTIQMAMMFSCLIPFLLPRMHERYMFLGDVIGVLYAFLRPKHFWVSLLVIGASFASYFPFLFNSTPVPPAIASLMLGLASIFLVFDLIRSLYPMAFTEQKG
jgi:Gpi18-like mannosyltransferase